MTSSSLKASGPFNDQALDVVLGSMGLSRETCLPVPLSPHYTKRDPSPRRDSPNFMFIGHMAQDDNIRQLSLIKKSSKAAIISPGVTKEPRFPWLSPLLKVSYLEKPLGPEAARILDSHQQVHLIQWSLSSGFQPVWGHISDICITSHNSNKIAVMR